jgi:hypothetical protein
MKKGDDLLMLAAVTATCTDCAGERIFVPAGDGPGSGAFCCTTCDAAVFLLGGLDDPSWAERRVA